MNANTETRNGKKLEYGSEENSVGMWGFIVEVLGELEGDEEGSVSSWAQLGSKM